MYLNNNTEITTLTTSRDVEVFCHLILNSVVSKRFQCTFHTRRESRSKNGHGGRCGHGGKVSKGQSTTATVQTEGHAERVFEVYSEDGREARNKRAEQRRLRATGIEKLGEEEYKRLLQEIDKMTQTPVNIEQLIDK